MSKAKFHQDDEGNRSILRIVWAICMVGMIAIWGIVSIQAGELQSFGMGDAILMVGLSGSKVAQKFIELKK